MRVKETVPRRRTRLQRVGCRGGHSSGHRSHLERPEGTDHSGDWRCRTRRSGLSLGQPLRGGRGERSKVGRDCRTAGSGHRDDTAWTEHSKRHSQRHPARPGLSVDHSVPGGGLGCQPTVGGCTDRPKNGYSVKGQSDRSISTRAAMLTAVSCPSISVCLAVGNDAGDPSVGQAVPIDPTTGTIVVDQSIESLAGTGALNAVACHSTAQCVTAGSRFESSEAVTEILDPATGRRP